MKKKILLLEDNLYTAEDLIEEFEFILKEKQDLQIIKANNIDEANNTLDQILTDSDELIYIIVDLNMSPAGLTLTEKQETESTVLTGFIWVLRHVWNRPEFKDVKIIFYSAFVNRLFSNSIYKSLRSMEKRKLTIIDKNEYDVESFGEKLLTLIS